MQKKVLKAETQIRDPLLDRVDSALTIRRCPGSHLTGHSSHCRCRDRTRFPRSRWIHQCDLIVHLQAFNGSATFVLAKDFDLALFEAFAALEINDALAIFHEQRLAGDIEYVFLLVTGNHDLSRKTRPKAQVSVQKLDGNIKFCAHVPFPELPSGHAAYGLDCPAECLAWERIKL